MAGKMDELLGICLQALENGEGLEAILARYPQEADALRPLLESAVWMAGERKVVEPRPGFVSASRSRLIAQIEAEKAAPRAGWFAKFSAYFAGSGLNRRYALQVVMVVLMIGCLVLGSSGIAYAAQEALPGERLYPVKLALEEAELLVTFNLEDDIGLHAQFSQIRLLEVQELVMEGEFGGIHQAVDNYEYHVQSVMGLLVRLASRDPELAQELAYTYSKMLADQTALLAFLMAAVPDEVKVEIGRAVVISESSEKSLQEVIRDTGGSLPTNQASATENVSPAEMSEQTPTPLFSATPTILPTSTATVTPSVTPSPSPTGFTPTATLRTSSPTPTVRTNAENPTPPPPEPTDPPPPPEKTKKPPPNPTRRPPRP